MTELQLETVPFADAKAPEAPATPAPTPELHEAEPRLDKTPVDVRWNRLDRPRQILFVDDDESFLTLCERRFAESDYGIKMAQSADEALALMAEETIDVVVSDLCMPGKNGAELMREVEKKHPDVVRIIVSGKMDIGETIEAINKGHIHHYVVKPFKDRDLKLTLYQALLERERAEAEQRRQHERQQNIKRRARELGQLVVRTKHEVQAAYGEAIDALEGLAPEKSEDVANTAGFLSHAMGLADEMKRQVNVAVRLRNICAGAEEKSVAARSARVVGRLTAFAEAAKIVACHGERFDGSGVPLGLMGDEIPLGARIVGLAEDYAKYRREGLSHFAAVDELAKCEARYDPRLLERLGDLADFDCEDASRQ